MKKRILVIYIGLLVSLVFLAFLFNKEPQIMDYQDEQIAVADGVHR